MQLRNNVERIWRTSAKDLHKGAEVLERYKDDSLKAGDSGYLKIERTKTSFQFEFVSESVDSLGVTITRGKDTLLSRFFKGRTALIPKVLCEHPKNTITVSHYWTCQETDRIDHTHRGDYIPQHDCGLKDSETTTFPILIIPIVAPVSYLINHPLDKVLPLVKECLKHVQ